MTAGDLGRRDLVTVHVRADLPIRARALAFADRVEVRFGNAFPVVLLIDAGAVDQLCAAIKSGQGALEAATYQGKSAERE